MKRIHFEQLDSTNSYIKKNYQDLEHLTWITSTNQTDGRGRSTKTWFGDQNSLLCSILIKESLSIELIPLIPLLAAKSLHQVLSKYHSNILIKWPNDLLIGCKKISGILVESISLSSSFEAVIIGFGINLNQVEFPSNLKYYSTSLSMETNQLYSLDQILHEINLEFINDFQIFKKNHLEVIHYCNKYLAYKNQMISYILNDDLHHAYVEYINHSGHLVVRENGHLTALNSGEITLKK
ncbi:MAG: biotin--[acetyl-CoA-carboxylase] ligase [Acholeplasmataceae bacterium]|nr:biotin--[acetyl-CoA-carboxylase] ligase [Acholeplasmataceae bacterium]